MPDFLAFVGQYWWLAFPLFGVLAAVGRAWERGARGRHKRRLEVLKAKAELKSAQAAVRAAPRGAPAPSPVVETQEAQLQTLLDAHDAVTKRWLDYELDVAKLIAFPAMSDGRQPLTAAFLRAKKVADRLRPASAKARLTPQQFAEYRDAVTDYEVAFDVAERDARRLKDSSFTDSERRRLDTAKQLLTTAIDQAATPAERQLAYRRVREELDGLISLSDGAIEVLEQKVSLELTTGATPQATDAATPRVATGPASGTSAPGAPVPHPGSPAHPAASDGAGRPAPWPVPARNSSTAPGRVIRPKQHP